jgi:phage-related protein
MPIVGPRCHELRIRDEAADWRIIYRLDHDAVLIAAVFRKKSPHTPQNEIDASKARLRRYDYGYS